MAADTYSLLGEQIRSSTEISLLSFSCFFGGAWGWGGVFGAEGRQLLDSTYLLILLFWFFGWGMGGGGEFISVYLSDLF